MDIIHWKIGKAYATEVSDRYYTEDPEVITNIKDAKTGLVKIISISSQTTKSMRVVPTL